jgi:hypothetical protein
MQARTTLFFTFFCVNVCVYILILLFSRVLSFGMHACCCCCMYVCMYVYVCMLSNECLGD